MAYLLYEEVMSVRLYAEQAAICFWVVATHSLSLEAHFAGEGNSHFKSPTALEVNFG